MGNTNKIKGVSRKSGKVGAVAVEKLDKFRIRVNGFVWNIFHTT